MIEVVRQVLQVWQNAMPLPRFLMVSYWLFNAVWFILTVLWVIEWVRRKIRRSLRRAVWRQAARQRIAQRRLTS